MSDVQKVLKQSFLANPIDSAVGLGAVAIVLMIIVPLPTVLLDMLMAVNLVISLLIFLIVLFTKKATDFSIFPTMLLVMTIFGLALNISSTRSILTMGIAFDGRMIRAFSTFVIGAGGTDGLVIGFVIFIIIIAVQAGVITKGASRIAEVAARFTLDGLPGKQMAIEAEYNSGAITEDEAISRKEDVQREVDFYGQMDGASKFVSGNVKIGILISVINMIGGIIIGMIFHKESIMDALSTYTLLTIGDGLLSQLPSLLVSAATGFIVTRANAQGTFGFDIKKQFSQNSKIYYIASIVLLIMAFFPGFPWWVLIPLAAATGYLGYRLAATEMHKKEAANVALENSGKKQDAKEQEMSPVVPLDPISLELGYGLIPLVDKDKGAELLDRITRIRKESALDMGLVVPRIRILDNMRLEPSEYCFKIKGMEVGRGTIRMGFYLSINPGNATEEIQGEKTKDPAFGLPAYWIPEEMRDKAERYGYTVVDAPSIIATHLTEIIKRYAKDILGRQEIQSMLETFKKDYPVVVEEAMKSLGLGDIQKVLQGLLREQISIRNLAIILETLADYSGVTKDAGFLIEKVRQALGRQICLQYADPDKVLHVLTIDPALEQKIIDSRVDTSQGAISALEPAIQRNWIKALTYSLRAVQDKGFYPVVLCSEAARSLVKSSTEREAPDLVVLSVPEIVMDIKVEAIAEIRIEGQI